MKKEEELAQELIDKIMTGASVSDITTILNRHNEKDDFIDSVRPLMEYLGANHHPHTKAVVDCTCAELLEGSQSFVTSDYVAD